jgi:sugar lactone lactonase YvrE
MRTRSLIVIILAIVVAFAMIWSAAAQGPEPRSGDRATPVAEPPRPDGGLAPRSLNSPVVALGQPGTVFRYVQSFGTNETAYLEDSSHLNYPYGVGTDGTNVWIAESSGIRAIKFTSGGNFITQIGKNAFRFGAGTASNITMDSVADTSVDSLGNIWLVDANVGDVLEFSPAGVLMSRLGRVWDRGSDNSRLNYPNGIAFDSGGNVYVGDTNNQRVQIFNSSGAYLTTIGISAVFTSTNAGFNNPRHIAIDGNDNLYVADQNNHRVQIFDPSHHYTASLGTSGVSGSDNDHFNHPEGVTTDSNFIYVADQYNHRVQIFNRLTRAYVNTIGGSYGSANDQLNNPTDVAVDTAGNIYIADNGNTRVQQFDSSLNYVHTYGTTGVPYVTDNTHFNQPSGIAVASDGSMYVLEERGQRLSKLNAAGVAQWTIGQPGVNGGGNTRFCYPDDVALDPGGNVYVADSCNYRVQIFNPAGGFVATLGTGYGSGNYQFGYAYSVIVDGLGNIIVGDTGNCRVQVFNSSRIYVATLGQTGVCGAGNNQFGEPHDVAVDASRNIYVADRPNHRVQVFNSSFAYVRTIGVTGISGSDFGHLSNPIAVAADSLGRTYVSDQYGTRVQIFDASGAYLTTLGGSYGSLTGQMRQVEGLALDKAGDLYSADLINHRYVKYAPGVPGWRQVNINGFGDRTNGNVHTLASFGGLLFAGTFNSASNGAQIWKTDSGLNWTPAIAPGFGITRNIGLNHLKPFNNQLYAGVRNDTDGASIYRTSDGSTWTPVVTAGFTDTMNASVYRFEVFNGQIYAGTGIFTNTHGAEIWRSPSGDAGSWSLVVTNGFGDVNNYIMRTSAVYNGYLYYGTQNVNTTTFNTTTGGIVIRSSTGNSGDWAKVTVDGFGDINNYTVSGLASFGGYLYASTTRWDVSGVQVWRCQTCDGSDWAKVVDNGFGNPNNYGISNLQSFNGQIYLVTGNGVTGLEVWRSTTGNSGEWTQLSAGGFGNSNNSSPYYNNVIIHNSALYVGTQNNANSVEVWEFLDKQLFLPAIQR